VYPAGHLYAYRALRDFAGTKPGVALETDPLGLLRVQAVFLVAYVATAALTLDVAGQLRAGAPWAAALFSLSWRLHSLFLLRGFNDCLSALAGAAALSLLVRRRWLLGALAWSAGVSVKMNGLLVLPALGLVLLRNTGPLRTAAYLAAAAALQVAVAVPFLRADARAYLGKAFELGRGCGNGWPPGSATDAAGLFLHRWSVNWAFLPYDVFSSGVWKNALLVGHVGALLALAHWRWSAAREGGLPGVVARVWNHFWWGGLHGSGEGGTSGGGGGTSASGGGSSSSRARRSGTPLRRRAGAALPHPQPQSRLPNAPALAPALLSGAFTDSPARIAWPLLTANFVGVVFARSLHYQFYAWYAFTLPLLAARARLPWPLAAAALVAVEAGFGFAASWGQDPPDPVRGDMSRALRLQAAAVTVGHALLLSGLLLRGGEDATAEGEASGGGGGKKLSREALALFD
jgi:alpha-1,3-mannosyltransferase